MLLALCTRFGITFDKTVPTFKVNDTLKDLDDTVDATGAAGLHRIGAIEIVGALGVLNPARRRAAALKGQLVELGLEDVPVGVGSDITLKEQAFGHETCAYLVDEEALVDGTELLRSVLEGSNGDLAITVCAGMTDIAAAITADPDLFAGAVANVIIMGGVNVTKDESTGSPVFTVTLDADGYMTPDTAANNAFDQAAAGIVYRFCQERGIELTILTREAAYTCQVKLGDFYSRMNATGSPIGAHLVSAQAPSLRTMWNRVNEPEGSSIRGTLPMRCNRAWFVTTFCSGNDPGEVADIWPHITAGQAYDLMAMLASVPAIRDRFFSPVTVTVNGVDHRVIGVNQKQNNAEISDVEGLREFMHELCIQTLLEYQRPPA